MEQQIVFRIAKQHFAVSILTTDRIIQLSDVTKMPDTSSYIMGVMNVEGTVLPIIDLPNRLYGQSLENKEEAQVLVVEWNEERIGLAVDEVLSVQSYDSAQVDEDPEKVSAIDHSISPIQMFIKTEDGIVLGLDIERLITENGTMELQQLMEPKPEAVSSVIEDE